MMNIAAFHKILSWNRLACAPAAVKGCTTHSLYDPRPTRRPWSSLVTDLLVRLTTTSRIQKGKARRLASPVHPFPAWQGSSETWLRTSRTFGGRSAFVSVHQRNRKRHEVCALSLATRRQVLLRWYGHIHPLHTTLSLLHREGRC